MDFVTTGDGLGAILGWLCGGGVAMDTLPEPVDEGLGACWDWMRTCWIPPG